MHTPIIASRGDLADIHVPPLSSQESNPAEQQLREALVASIPFIAFLGAKLTRFAHGEATLQLPAQGHFENSWQALHGGLLLTLLDSVMGLAGRSLDKEPLTAFSQLVTVQLNTHFLHAATGNLIATGQVVHHSFSIVVCESMALNEQGKICARGSATFKKTSMPRPSR